MTDAPELNEDTLIFMLARHGQIRGLPVSDKTKSAVADFLRSYGDQRYQAAIDDVVKWLNAKQEGRTSDNYPAFYANEITRRFGKDA
ncbi:MAG: hypothetical protein KG075_17100 [Alphaproteobacteria bacterium]|nr:hypothetical protein [Alphaproteobacteria bacterium]